MANELENPVMAATIPATIGWTMGYRCFLAGAGICSSLGASGRSASVPIGDPWPAVQSSQRVAFVERGCGCA
jgi:hypothetical protein